MAEQESRSKGIQFMNPVHFSWKPDRDVHVWKFPAISTGLSLLTVSEREFANRFRFEGDRNRFAVGRQALRFLLSKYLSVNPLDIGIISEVGQKPFISIPSTNIYFNISHSGDWVLIAIAKEELGIDIEKVDPDFNFNDLLLEHFSEAEQSFISSEEDSIAAFYFLWTRKEALTKAWGTGLQGNLKMVPALDEFSFFDRHKKIWNLESFRISAEYSGALAYSSQLESIIYYDGSGQHIHGSLFL
jgi:4'-phosphopantetheinyl transferase